MLLGCVGAGGLLCRPMDLSEDRSRVEIPRKTPLLLLVQVDRFADLMDLSEDRSRLSYYLLRGGKQAQHQQTEQQAERQAEQQQQVQCVGQEEEQDPPQQQAQRAEHQQLRQGGRLGRGAAAALCDQQQEQTGEEGSWRAGERGCRLGGEGSGGSAAVPSSTSQAWQPVEAAALPQRTSSSGITDGWEAHHQHHRGLWGGR